MNPILKGEEMEAQKIPNNLKAFAKFTEDIAGMI